MIVPRTISPQNRKPRRRKTAGRSCFAGDVKQDFGTASIVGNCVVFNIAGNKYRLVTRILYLSQKVFILKVMTHREYDENKWQEACGCFEPTPSKPEQKTGPVPKRRKRGS